MSVKAEVAPVEQKKSWMPHTYVIIFGLIIIAALATWIIPAGIYDRVLDPATGRKIAQVGSFHFVQSSPVGFWKFWMLVQKGMNDAAQISLFILVIGGTFGLFTQSGAIDVLIAKVVTRFSGKSYDKWAFIFLFGFFYLCTATFNLAEQAMIFVPFIVIMAISLGYDAILANAVLVFAIALGCTGVLTGPFNLGIAQTIAGLPLYSGLGYRIFCSVVIFTIGSWWMLRYAKKIKKDPSKSLVADIDYSHVELHDDPSKVVMTSKHKAVLLVFGGSFLFMIFAIVKFNFYLEELTAFFLLVGILTGLVARMSLNEISDGFIDGAKSMIFAAILVGFARAIQTTLESGMILDTMIKYITSVLSVFPASVVGSVMVVVQSMINLVIPSCSAMAVVTMPIMVPLSDLLGVQRQTAVLAFQFGDGITNLILPTWDVLVIGLGLARIPFTRWFKFVLPLCGILIVVAMVLVYIAELIKVGPF